MDIKVMEYAAEIARRQSFTKAAEHLHIAQPSLSQQIKKLEAELGLTLFYRSHGSVTLTPHGRRFIEKPRTSFVQEMTCSGRCRSCRKDWGTSFPLGFLL